MKTFQPARVCANNKQQSRTDVMVPSQNKGTTTTTTITITITAAATILELGLCLDSAESNLSAQANFVLGGVISERARELSSALPVLARGANRRAAVELAHTLNELARAARQGQ